MELDYIKDLEKIRDTISGFFKKKARERVSTTLRELRKEVDKVNKRPIKERPELLRAMLNKYTNLRQMALRMGASSFSDPAWAAAAACESWALILCSNNSYEKIKAKKLVEEMINMYP